ncbi:MAG: type II toxin-antitoxin system Phd/YefM family antitoxin [Solirubrobacterales bacterium]
MPPKTQLNMHEAKTHLSKLVERVEKGEEITIARNGTPVAKLVPVAERFPVAPPGFMKGEVWVADDAFEPDEELIDSFYDSKVFPDDEGE